MNNIEDYQNLISLLRKALEFYANSNNYLGGVETAPMIVIDEHGSQARFALKKIDEFNKNQKELEEEFTKLRDVFSENKNINDTLKNIEDYGKLL